MTAVRLVRIDREARRCEDPVSVGRPPRVGDVGLWFADSTDDAPEGIPRRETQLSSEGSCLLDRMSTHTFPTLYELSSGGSIKQWTISVNGATITTEWGLKGGTLQKTHDTLKEGKNLGKANATTAEEQAMLEAEAKHTKKKKSGYVESLDSAEAGEVDALVQGGEWPMLAEVFQDHAHKVKYPAVIQKKYDGHRCIAQVDKAGKVTLWSRERRPIETMGHIVKELERTCAAAGVKDCFLDGELYIHGLRFQAITRLVKKYRPGESEKVQYHLYDIITDECYRARYARLSFVEEHGDKAVLVVAESIFVNSEAEAAEAFAHFVSLGYEGLMMRLLGEGYKRGKRTWFLLKMKGFRDAVARVKRLIEGSGKLAGHVAVYECETPDGRTIYVTATGPFPPRKKAWEDQTGIGEALEYQFFEFTDEGEPRFPTARRFVPGLHT